MWRPNLTLTAKTAADAFPAIGTQMQKVVVPQVRDRWLATGITEYTPDQIYNILRGALSGRLLYVWQLFDLMEDTWPRLATNLQKVRSSVKRHDWTIQAWAPKGQEPSAEAERRARLFEDAIYSMRPRPDIDELGWDGTLDALMDAWGKGVSVLEVDWSYADVDAGRLIVPRSTHWVHPQYYGWPSVDDFGGDRLMLRASEVVQRSEVIKQAGAEWIEFPANKFLLATCKARTTHPSAAARLRPLAWWWCAMNFSGQWLVNYAQLFGIPIRWATYDPGRPDLKTVLEQMLENMGSAGWAAMPDGTALQLFEGKGTGADNPQASILDRADKNCDIYLLGQTLSTDVGSTGGNRALGEVHKDVQDEVSENAIRWTAGVLNQQLIPAWCELNFGDRRECPYFIDREAEGKDAKGAAETFKIVLDSGVEIPRAYYYEAVGIPVPQAGEEVISPRPVPAPGQFGRPDPSNGFDPADPAGPAAAACRHSRLAYHAKSAEQQKLADAVLEDITGVEAAWLGAARPWLKKLVIAAEDPKVTDAEFIAMLERAQRNVPTELAPLLNPEAVSESLEKAMGAAVVNGAVDGYLKRAKSRKSEARSRKG